ncbi:FAS1 domain-containing protein [Viridothelium virens]|uniref:FAS1 domain-containing protein n=1 Tax=Viridothelium virens TaxID=1048519 RepID=A0A6A6H8K7_VIRVR|nr:FAS1 domain-containing protein [Viridothelium virens]
MATAPNIALPDSGTGSNDGSNNPSSSVLISDVVGRPHNINIFAGFTRDISAISSRLDSSSANSTILAPLNAEIYKLPRKPWEDPKEYERLGTQAYEGVGGEGRANENLKRFIEAHIVPESPWEEGRKVKTLAGRELWWERSKGGSKLIQPEGVEVENVADKVANGEVWILKGVLNYAS